MPEIGDHVIVFDGFIDVASWLGYKDGFCMPERGESCEADITHWMPLPEKPKEKE